HRTAQRVLHYLFSFAASASSVLRSFPKHLISSNACRPVSTGAQYGWRQAPPASYGVCRIEPYGLRSALQVLRRIGTGWSTASSASVGRMVYGYFLQRDSPRDLTRRSCGFLQSISRYFGAHKGGDGLH